jgi:hypothetical protein
MKPLVRTTVADARAVTTVTAMTQAVDSSAASVASQPRTASRRIAKQSFARDCAGGLSCGAGGGRG